MRLHGPVISFMAGTAAMVSLASCNGIFGGIYDAPETDADIGYGFIVVDDERRTGRIYIDATDYAEWHYIDLDGRRVVQTPVEGMPPERWDFAVHRYDVKTNGGAVWESAAGDFGSIPDLGTLSPDDFTCDEWTTDRITVDMSQMMDGVIVYAEDYRNPCLSRWLDVDTSTMPPIYTLSGKVYLLRLADGTHAALRLANFMDDAAVKGFLTIDYMYPVEP